MPKSKKPRPTCARRIPQKHDLYPHLSSTNDQPLDSEVDEIRLVIEDTKLRLEEQQKAPQLDVAQTRQESKELRAIIRTCMKIIHPIRCLPFEIIGEILLHTLSGPDHWNNYPEVHDYHHGPWAYSRVCRRWRAVAISLPRLWSELLVPSNCGSYWLHVKNPIGRLQLWLRRSGSCPLRILYSASGKCRPKEHDTITSLLFEQSDRWEVFRWIGCSDPERFERLSEVVGRVPLLRHLDLQYTIADNPQELETAASYTGFTALQPRLVRFHAERFLVDPFELLRLAPNLWEVALVLNRAHGDIPRKWFPPSRLTHSSIRRLVVNHPYMIALPNLILPQLKCLGLRSFTLDDMHLVAGLIHQSRCPLTNFFVQGQYRFHSSLVQVLQATPALELLTLAGDDSMPLYQYQEGILEQLTIQEGFPVLLPALKVFSCDVKGVDPEALVAMLESRCEEGHLQKVKLWCAQTPVKKWVGARFLRRVTDLRKKDVEVVVEDIPWSNFSQKMEDLVES
ncbi:uncharacterized protein BT62DRAFT_915664 [Guyanagaster necrorhizus]|uniref:F-box domain-containing protein n=1 Tax=Guyanagaster necrorhizus TaxID=856835 RepID=A0A9P8AZD4_9AGAR|nr:uncharacterized protein BT62DRAFT_915664 [Guyanagaster necrorhizus MCA 3950]KAG7451852.1 hypothetical protein BT62DRAFT_915664 [Guyanagaster necrorhizus MCA 3950]